MKKILAIVEGEKADVKLMNHLFSLFYKDKFYIWPYKTNLYDLYDKLKINDDDSDYFESLDIKQVIKSRENDVAIRNKLDEKFTDIILIFDFDPQDPRYTSSKVQKMKKLFNESSDNGKLYINYPMVESFKHIKSINDCDYIYSTVKFDELVKRQYKAIVNKECFQCDYLAFNEDMCLYVFKQNLIKINYILYNKDYLPNTVDEYELLDLVNLLDIQINSLSVSNRVFIVCTCIMYLIDYKPQYFIEKLNSINKL